MSKVELARIPALTFYLDEKTSYRRTTSLPQLVCVGKPCNLYQPEVVRCVNLGGRGVDVDWKVSPHSYDCVPFLNRLWHLSISVKLIYLKL